MPHVPHKFSIFSSGLPNMSVGHLFLLTCEGGKDSTCTNFVLRSQSDNGFITHLQPINEEAIHNTPEILMFLINCLIQYLF